MHTIRKRTNEDGTLQDQEFLTKLVPIPVKEEKNWYEWCIKNWGTKWDMDIEDCNGPIEVEYHDDR